MKLYYIENIYKSYGGIALCVIAESKMEALNLFKYHIKQELKDYYKSRIKDITLLDIKSKNIYNVLEVNYIE